MPPRECFLIDLLVTGEGAKFESGVFLWLRQVGRGHGAPEYQRTVDVGLVQRVEDFGGSLAPLPVTTKKYFREFAVKGGGSIERGGSGDELGVNTLGEEAVTNLNLVRRRFETDRMEQGEGGVFRLLLVRSDVEDQLFLGVNEEVKPWGFVVGAFEDNAKGGFGGLWGLLNSVGFGLG